MQSLTKCILRPHAECDQIQRVYIATWHYSSQLPSSLKLVLLPVKTTYLRLPPTWNYKVVSRKLIMFNISN